MQLFCVEFQRLFKLNAYELEEIKTDTDRGLTKSPTAGFVRKDC